MSRSKSPNLVLETTFTSYTLERVIGEGGSGRVHLAKDEAGKQWAIKILNPRNTSTEHRKRFKNEILFCQRTQHPNIVQVVDHGLWTTENGRAPFYVMRVYPKSLRTIMPGLRDNTRRLQLFDQMLSGVEAAHFLGVVHRDLKPENVLCDVGGGSLVIGDFGVAHFTGEELYTSVETAPHTRLANFQYAAPEQRCRGVDVDHRADIYALGLILNELFTGRIPLGAGYRTVGSGTPEYAWVDQLVESMLQQDPELRPHTIESVKRALIARRQDFVERQRLSELDHSVVPTTREEDPLTSDPPRIVDFEWGAGTLQLILSRPVNSAWVWALQHMGGYTSVANRGPQAFTFKGNHATIQASDDEVQSIIDYFKNWMPQVTAVYKQRLEHDREAAERAYREKVRAEQDEIERRRRVRASVKL